MWVFKRSGWISNDVATFGYGYAKPNATNGLAQNKLFYGSLERLGTYFHLQYLDLSGNQLETLPPHLEDLTQIQHLILADNLLTEIPECIYKLKTLLKMDLHGNKVGEVGLQVARLENLTMLDLGNNRIRFLPIHHGEELLGMSKLSKLQHLNLAGNRLEKVPDSMGKLNLHWINLSNNPGLQEIPDAWHDLPLTWVDVGATNVNTLPAVVGHWKQLQTFTMNKIPQLESMGHHLGYMTGLVKLDLSNCSLASIPQELDLLENLQVLDLRKNMLQKLPMIKGSKLVQVLLGNNYFLEVPAFLLQPLPIRVLDLSSNLLSVIPSELSTNLVHLDRLALSGNRLEVLPPTIKHLNQLRTLECRNNQLSGIPKEIGGCAALQKLDVVTNMILQLPDTFRLLDNLKVFEAMDNPWMDPPQEVIHAGLQAVMLHLKKRPN
jgi:Leucine-rich repeat (LRR) protein